MSMLLNHHQLINVAGLVPGRQSNGLRHHWRKESEKSPRSVKMTCGTTTASTTLRASGLRMSSFSRTNKIMVRTPQDFYPKVARSRCVVKVMFERFNEKAIRAIMIAQDESRRLGHCYVGTEQILLGLIGEGTGIAARVLMFMGINYEDARLQVEKIIGMGSGSVALDIPFTPPVKRVLELSGEESHQLGHLHIGTEHLLLGLLREGEGVATHVLKNMGVDATKIRRQVICMAFMGPRSNINKMPTLEEYFTNLTKLAEEGKLDPVVGRKQEIERVIQLLLRHTKNNPVLIGEPGVGKTAIVEGLAQWIANGDVPETLEGKKIVTLDMGLVVAGTKYHGELKERLNKLVEEIKQRDDIIVFIDEEHTSIGDGLVYKGEIDAGNILKPALARGELQCIVATTVDKYNKRIEKDSILKRRFQIVEVSEPSVDETIQILKGLKERYEIHHKLRYTDEALVAAANLSYQYISDRFLPDKAIDLIDEAGSWVRLRHAKGPAELPEEVGEEEKEVRQIVKEKEEAVRNQDYEKAIELRQEEMAVKVYISELIKKGKEMSKAENEAGDHGGLVVTKADIQNVVSSSTGIPVEKLSTGD